MEIRDEYGGSRDKTFKHRNDVQAFGSFTLPRSRMSGKRADVKAAVNHLCNLRQVMSQPVSIGNEGKWTL